MNQVYTTHEVLTNKLTWNSLLAQTYRTYQERFWLFFCMGLPVALLAYLYRPTQRFLLHRILANPDAASWRWHHPVLYVGIGILLAFIEGAFYWLTSAIFFAAVADQIVSNRSGTAGLMLDSYARVRGRFAELFRLGMLTWTPFWLGRSVTFGLILLALSALGMERNWNVLFIGLGLALLIIAGLFSRIGLAVPELMANPAISARQAVRNSIRKTGNWELFFTIFLAKAAAVGYGAFWIADWVLARLYARNSMSSAVYDWATWAIYICIAAALESPLFIAFSILYRQSHEKQNEALTAPAIG